MNDQIGALTRNLLGADVGEMRIRICELAAQVQTLTNQLREAQAKIESLTPKPEDRVDA